MYINGLKGTAGDKGMKTINIEFPEEVIELYGEEELRSYAKKWSVLILVKRGKLSSDKASEILGMNKCEFMELMSSDDILIADLYEDEIKKKVKGSCP